MNRLGYLIQVIRRRARRCPEAHGAVMSAVFFALVLAVPSLASAQGTLTGIVRDPSGSLLPGVTVEATSPAIIEKTRTVVTDGSGQYRIINLKPGVYTVTFSLNGFKTVRRGDIQIAGTATVTIPAELVVG